MAVVIHSDCAEATTAHEPVERSSSSASAFRCGSMSAITFGLRSSSAMRLSTALRSLSWGSGSGAR